MKNIREGSWRDSSLSHVGIGRISKVVHTVDIVHTVHTVHIHIIVVHCIKTVHIVHIVHVGHVIHVIVHVTECVVGHVDWNCRDVLRVVAEFVFDV